jgi:DNA-binding response OmpR family regulator
LKHRNPPLSPPEPDPVSRPSDSTLVNGAVRILVIDDDPDLRRDYAEVLVRAGYWVDSAEDIAASWSWLDARRHGAHHYDLVITNNLPQACAPELALPAHATPKTLLVLLIPLAGHEHAGRIHLAAILPRPFDPAQLPERVRTILRHTLGANVS